MSTAAATPNSCLLSILLIVQSRTGAGPQTVFHYPPDPLALDIEPLPQRTSDAQEDESSSSDSGDESSSDESAFNRRRGDHESATPRSYSTVQKSSVKSNSETAVSIASYEDDRPWQPAWEPLLGLGEDELAVLLCPGVAWHKRKFEMSINNLTFIGRPLYARHEGFWRKVRRKNRESRSMNDVDPGVDQTGSSSDLDDTQQVHRDNKRRQARSSLTMFHVVFVLDPPPLVYSLRVKEMYENVAKKLSRVLRWAQARHDYVWQQSETMLSIRNKHLQARSTTATLYAELLARSPLAGTLANIYTSISTSKIASFTLMPGISSSLQIPPVTSTAYLPSLMEPPIQPGLWLTTASGSPSGSLSEGNNTPDGASQVFKMFTLLLRQNSSRVLKDIQTAGGPLAPVLTNFVSLLKPTKSFHKLSTTYQISLADIHLIARHFIDWRRGIATPPLHQRDTYILSPNANLSRLEAACKAYKSQFPTLPSLPEMLHALSGVPRPYGFFLPSSDHKQAYYEVLAWLMRGGWVTQLRTFGFVRVAPEIKFSSKRNDSGHEAAKDQGLVNTKSSPGSNGFEVKAGKRPSVLSRPSSDGGRSSNGGRARDNPKHARLVLDPARASPQESAWLDQVGEHLSTSLGSKKALDKEEMTELRSSWHMFLKYFNGQDALETIAVREGMKRKHIWELLGRLGLDFDNGVECPSGGNKATVVTVRHW